MIKLFKKKANRIRGKKKFKDAAIYGAICSHADFFSLIEFERSRSHRVQKPFSVILIDIDQQNDYLINVELIVNDILKRIRKIDQLGWYDNNRIGILLPNTDHNGANVIIEDLTKKIDDKRIKIRFDTFSYPS